MPGNEQYDSVVASCEATVRNRGHVLDVWYPVDERLHASICKECGDTVWVTRSGNEECWRVGGEALRQYCLGEGREEVIHRSA